MADEFTLGELADIILEATEEKMAYVSTQFNMDMETVRALDRLDPAQGKYLVWLARMYRAGHIVLPEDAEKVAGRLKQFQTLSAKPGFTGNRDINAYATYGDLAKAVELNSEVKTQGDVRRQLITQGSQLMNTRRNLALYKITTPEAAAKLLRHTEWCIKDPKYFRQYNPSVFYMIAQDDKPFRLLHIEAINLNTPAALEADMQLKDVYDDPVFDLELYQTLGLPGIEKILHSPNWLARKAIHTGVRNPSIEDALTTLRNSIAGTYAARFFRRAPWPKVEEAIVQGAPVNPYLVYRYVETHKSLPQAAVKRALIGTEWALSYAIYHMAGRWPEAEAVLEKQVAENPAAVKIQDLSSYIREYVQGRWVGAEPYIMQQMNVFAAVDYVASRSRTPNSILEARIKQIYDQHRKPNGTFNEQELEGEDEDRFAPMLYQYMTSTDHLWKDGLQMLAELAELSDEGYDAYKATKEHFNLPL